MEIRPPELVCREVALIANMQVWSMHLEQGSAYLFQTQPNQ